MSEMKKETSPNLTRRKMLKILGSLMVAGVAQPVLGKRTPKAPSVPRKKEASLPPKKASCKETKLPPKTPVAYPIAYDRLWQAYFPTLKKNEGEKLCFYRCANSKVTIGYGSKIEGNTKQLDNTTVYYKGRALSKEKKALFLSQLTSKTNATLMDYSITRGDAEKIAKNFAYQAMHTLDTEFKEIHFVDLPIPMQALALDVFYHVGRDSFKKYKLFRSALAQKDYATALAESKVYLNTKTRSVSLKRERRKRRLFRIQQIIQENRTKTQDEIQKLVAQSYKKEMPLIVRLCDGTTDKAAEDAIIKGELERLKLKSNMRPLMRVLLKGKHKRSA